MYEFRDGMELSEVVYPAGQDKRIEFKVGIVPFMWRETATGVERIVVEMVAGEASMVPWAKIIGQSDTVLGMVNLLKAEYVSLRNGQ
tara:strand:+ start:32890 stop:33150 length:261 start_codon:yes stop_codon:yes gene_type:complete